MHAIKVAELIFERMHFTRELAEFDISYNGEILESGVHSSLHTLVITITIISFKLSCCCN